MSLFANNENNAAVVTQYTESQAETLNSAIEELQDIFYRLHEDNSPVGSPETGQKLRDLSVIGQGLPLQIQSYDPHIHGYCLSPLQFAAYFLWRMEKDLCLKFVIQHMYPLESDSNRRALLKYCLQRNSALLSSTRSLIFELHVPLYLDALLDISYGTNVSWLLALDMIRLGAGLNLKLPDLRGNSVLHLICIAASKDSNVIENELVEALLREGADARQRNGNGELPVQILIQHQELQQGLYTARCGLDIKKLRQMQKLLS